MKIYSFVILFILFTIHSCFAFDKVRFAVVSDCHLSMAADGVTDDFKMGVHSAEFLESTIKSINEIKDLDFVLFLGDITKDGEPWNVDKFTEMISELKVPSYVILGNHDQSVITEKEKAYIPGVSKATIVWALQGHGFNGPKSWWSADPVDGLHIVGLDTNIVGTWFGHVTEEEITWLNRDLSENKNKFVIVTGHHSIIPFSAEEEKKEEWKSFYLDNKDRLLELFDKYKVKFYLSGHRHVSTRAIEKNGTYHIVHPSTSTYPMRYTIYSLTHDLMEYEVKDVPMTEDIRNIGKENFFKFGTFWRLSEWSDNEEGNKKFLDYYESNNTILMKIPLK